MTSKHSFPIQPVCPSQSIVDTIKEIGVEAEVTMEVSETSICYISVSYDMCDM